MTPTLTTPQRAALKTSIQADPTGNALLVAGNLEGLAAHLNGAASPTFTVWKSFVSKDDVAQKGFNPTELAGLTQLNTTRLQNLSDWFSTINPSQASVRQFFDDIFSGAGGVNTRAALLVLWKRLATRAERPFATGTGSDAVPGLIVSEGPITTAELVNL